MALEQSDRATGAGDFVSAGHADGSPANHQNIRRRRTHQSSFSGQAPKTDGDPCPAAVLQLGRNAANGGTHIHLGSPCRQGVAVVVTWITNGGDAASPAI